MDYQGYHCSVEDIKAWEAKHGKIPEDSVVMVRSDWHKKWAEVSRYNKKPFPGVSLDALKFLHLERKILIHGHEPQYIASFAENLKSQDRMKNHG